VLVTVVATGIGMTTGLGLAEHVVGSHLDGGRDAALSPIASPAASSALPSAASSSGDSAPLPSVLTGSRS